ncbi:MAG: PfkB family carbohydrate kinase [Streptococcus salivarius]
MMATGMRQRVFNEVVDTVGAGDSHVGAFISARLEA